MPVLLRNGTPLLAFMVLRFPVSKPFLFSSLCDFPNFPQVEIPHWFSSSLLSFPPFPIPPPLFASLPIPSPKFYLPFLPFQVTSSTFITLSSFLLLPSLPLISLSPYGYPYLYLYLFICIYFLQKYLLVTCLQVLYLC